MSITDGYIQQAGGFYKISDGSGPYAIDDHGVATLLSSGGGDGGSGGGVTNDQLREEPVPVELIAGHFRHLGPGFNRSGVIAAANVWQVVAESNSNRTGIDFHVIAEGSEMFVCEFDTTGLQGGDAGTIRLQAGQTYSGKSNNTISVLCATEGVPYTAIEYLDS